MQPDSSRPDIVETYLRDMMVAMSRISEFCDGKEFVDFEQDIMLQSAVERQFTILGEALIRVERLDAEVAKAMTDYRRIIGFRHVLAHDYGKVEAAIVWNAFEDHLPVLRAEVAALLAEE